VLLACDSDSGLRRRLREALGETGMTADTAHAMLLAVRAAGGPERARRRALAYADEATAELAALPASSYRDALAELARVSVDRVA
jgi:octaprenyl-diphosphate synthase